MIRLAYGLRACVVAASLCTASAGNSQEVPSAAGGFVAIPPNMDNDLRLYLGGGRIVKGAAALQRIPAEADLILWLAGNQFFAMDAVIGAFQERFPRTKVGLLTLPSGLLLTAIQQGGLTYQGNAFPGRPDVYGSVNLGHLMELRRTGQMDSFAVYMHNEIELMVAKGNPKRIRGIPDLARPDVRSSLPNPVNEGLMQFYGRRALERHGIWNRISAGRECAACQTTPNNWFTAAHHRETPERILDGRSDVGMVWKTETLAARRAGARVESVSLPPEDSFREEVTYVIGALTATPRQAAARRYLEFLTTSAAQERYASFGFVKATAAELKLRPIP